MESIDIVSICAVIALLALLVLLLPYFKARTRRRMMSGPPPAHWVSFLERNLSLYPAMPEALRSRLLQLMKVFLAEKGFEGCGGLELSEDMKLSVASQACLLLLGRERPSFFPTLQTILLYPSQFYSEERTSAGGGALIDEECAEKLGESWHSGAIILSWAHVKREGNHLNDGVNVVLHEFAHQLDEESGFADGAPSLDESGLSYREWSQVMSREYASLLKELRRGRRDVIDGYGASNPAEFFAVATETFFEKPLALRQRRPKLYEEFAKFYKLDPASWLEKISGQKDSNFLQA